MSILNRYEFVLLFDVKNGNPNGDPDSGNQPRIDPDTNVGIVTDVCIKRKIRNSIPLLLDVDNNRTDDHGRFRIYITEKAVLNCFHQEAHDAVAEDIAAPDGEGDASSESSEQPAKKKKAAGPKRKGSKEIIEKAQEWMCRHFYDVRTFGAVMSTGVNCGQVRGPVQIMFGESVEPVISTEHTITRMAVTTEKEAESQAGDNRTMGRKHTIPYGLYRAHGFISANLAAKTGFDERDLEMLWDALTNMFEFDRSASRGEMATRGLYVFRHDSGFGNAHAHTLFEKIRISRKTNGPARNFSDYEVEVDDTDLPAGVSLKRMVG